MKRFLFFLAALVVSGCGAPSTQSGSGQAPAEPLRAIRPGDVFVTIAPVEAVATEQDVVVAVASLTPEGEVNEKVEEQAGETDGQEALATLEAFMEARLRQNEDAARSFLSPDLQQTVPYEELLPASSPRWLSYSVLSQVERPDGVVEATVQVALAAAPVGEEIDGWMEQSVYLEQQDEMWVVVGLSAQSISMLR